MTHHDDKLVSEGVSTLSTILQEDGSSETVIEHIAGHLDVVCVVDVQTSVEGLMNAVLPHI